MSKKKIPSRKALIEALRANHGNMAGAARAFHCDRRRIWHLVNDDLELRTLVDDLAEEFIDQAESNFYKHVEDGNLTALIFFLKTQGKSRGWSERLELVPLNRQDIEVELGSPTHEIKDHNSEALNGNGAAIALLEQ